MPEGITLKRIIDMDEAQQLSSSDYVLVDSSSGGNRKYNLGEDLNNLKEDFYDSLVTDTASGAIASFPDGADNVPVKSMTVAIEPVQAGSGDPSPTNIRPISGHTSAVVTRCGKNIADFTNEYTIPGTGLPSSYAKRSATVTPIPIKEGKAYRFLCAGTHICGIYSVLDAENNLVRRVTGVDSGTVLNTSDGAYLYVCGYDTSDTVTVTADGNNLMVVLDTETDTAYEPYNGQTVTIDLGGTIYGGTLDVTTGVLTVDRIKIDLDATKSYGVASTTDTYATFMTQMSPNAKGTAFISNRFSNNISSGAGRMVLVSNTLYFVITKSELSTVNEAGVREWLTNNPTQLVYELATPQTIQLTAQEVRTLLGQNNVFADCGDVSVEYRADTKLYIQKVISG